MQQNTTTYQRTSAGQKFVKQALTKMVVYFKDGNNRTFHSRDHRLKHTGPDKDLGINRLKKLAHGWKAHIQCAIIYDNVSGAELYKYKEGYWA